MDPSNPRKQTGCKLEIRIRLRQPLLKPEIVEKQERWMQLDFTSCTVAMAPIESRLSHKVEKPIQVVTNRAPEKSPRTQRAQSEDVNAASTASAAQTQPVLKTTPSSSEEPDVDDLILQFKRLAYSTFCISYSVVLTA